MQVNALSAASPATIKLYRRNNEAGSAGIIGEPSGTLTTSWLEVNDVSGQTLRDWQLAGNLVGKARIPNVARDSAIACCRISHTSGRATNGRLDRSRTITGAKK